MIQEHKDLLLKDLCARLPYGVKIDLTWWVMDEGTYINTTIEPDHIEQLLNNEDGNIEIKPYLFPLSSMTEEQRNEYHELLYNPKHGINIDYFDWCHKNHLDCRGLIPIGLANNAVGLNIY